MAKNEFHQTTASTAAPAAQAKIVDAEVNACWMMNFEEEITIPNPNGTYYQMLNLYDKFIVYDFEERKYKISICFNPIKANTLQTVPTQSELNDPMTMPGVTLRFRVSEPQAFIYKGSKLADVTEKDLLYAKKEFESGVNIFNNRFNLIIKDPLCGERNFPIRFVINWVKSSEHFGIYVKNAEDLRAANKVRGIEIPAKSSKTIFAHEFGHGFGLADEYIEGSRKFVKYIKPDGTFDNYIEIFNGGRKESDPLATLYSCMTSTALNPRHGWPIAIEVQKLLARNIFRAKGQEIRCDIEMI